MNETEVNTIELLEELKKEISEINSENIKHLISNGADIKTISDDMYRNTVLHIAALSNDVELAKMCIESGILPNHKNETFDTPLHFAALTDSLEVAEFLISVGAGLEEVNEYNDTPLHTAAGNDSEKVSELLINSGANLETTNWYNESPIDATSSNKIKRMIIKSKK